MEYWRCIDKISNSHLNLKNEEIIKGHLIIIILLMLIKLKRK